LSLSNGSNIRHCIYEKVYLAEEREPGGALYRSLMVELAEMWGRTVGSVDEEEDGASRSKEIAPPQAVLRT